MVRSLAKHESIGALSAPRLENRPFPLAARSHFCHPEAGVARRGISPMVLISLITLRGTMGKVPRRLRSLGMTKTRTATNELRGGRRL